VQGGQVSRKENERLGPLHGLPRLETIIIGNPVEMNQADPQKSHSSYTLEGRGEIMERLRMMERQKTLLNVVPAGQSSGFITTIIKILPDKKLIAIDAAVNEQVNDNLRKAGSIVVSAQINGVHAQFSANSVTPAQLGGQNVLAIPIPESLYWRERRQFYRLPLPHAMPVKCSIPVSEDKLIQLPVADVSLTGLAAIDKHNRFDRSTPVGTLFVNCALDLPAFEGEKFALNLCSLQELGAQDGERPLVRLGFSIQGASRGFEIHLQKFLFEVELQIKKSLALVKD
jgi:flagellar brake protein